MDWALTIVALAGSTPRAPARPFGVIASAAAGLLIAAIVTQAGRRNMIAPEPCGHCPAFR